VVWSADCKSLFYIKLDDNHRPMQVWRHRLGTKQADDVLIYQETDPGWFTHLHESTSGRFCVIAGGDHETSEQRLIDLAYPDAPPRLIAPREANVQYSIADRSDQLFILTNVDGAIDFKIVTAPLASPERANWRDLIPHRAGVYILDHDLYSGHLVRLERAKYRDRLPHELSGGERQRIGVARALAAKPRIVLMDEPFGALDPLTRDALGDDYRALHSKLGLTTVMITHDMTEALLLADRIAVMRTGRLLALGTPLVLSQSRDSYVMELLSTPRRQADRLNALLPRSAGG